MTGYTTGLFDRLLGDRGPGPRLSLEQLRDAVARDLEDLLNTRMALPEEMLDAWPQCAASLLKLAQVSPHFWKPSAQAVLHEPFAQTAGAVQAVPQTPQLPVSDCRLTQAAPHADSPG